MPLKKLIKHIINFTEALTLALILEVSAYPKPGNVHRLRDRAKLRYEAFLATGVFAYKYFKRGVIRGVREFTRRVVLGDLVYGLMRDVISRINSSNTCLGSSLLLSLLSVSAGRCIKSSCDCAEDVAEHSKSVIKSTTVLDSIYYYMAVRLASPSYIKPSDYTGEYVNVWDPEFRRKLREKEHRLYNVLQYSSKFDVVAREAINGFQQCLKAERFLRSRISENRELNKSIVETYLYLLSSNLDTIVLLKHGYEVAREVSLKASITLEKIQKAGSNWVGVISDLDDEFHRRNMNPGAIADLVAATLALYMFNNVLSNSTLLDLSY